MQYNPANPLIVQGDRTVLLEVDNPLHAEARDAIAPFAELEKSPEHIHTYRLTPALALERRGRRDVGRRDDRGAVDLQQIPAPAQPADRPPRAGQPLRPGQPAAGRRPAPPDHATTRRCSRSWPGRRGSATTSASGSTRPASPSTTPSAGVLKQALIARRLSGRGPGRLHRGGGARHRAPRGRRGRASRSGSATTRGWPSTRSTPGATSGAARA